MFKKVIASIVFLSAMAYGVATKVVANASFIGLTGNLSTTTLYTTTATGAGVYRVSMVLDCTSATMTACNNAQLYLGWTNEFGTQTAVSLGTPEGFPSFTIYAVDSSAITAMISFGSGTPSANAYLVVEKLPVP